MLAVPFEQLPLSHGLASSRWLSPSATAREAGIDSDDRRSTRARSNPDPGASGSSRSRSSAVSGLARIPAVDAIGRDGCIGKTKPMQGVLFPDHPPSRMARVPGHEARGVGGLKGGRGQERAGSHADQDERGCAKVASQSCRGRDALQPSPNPVGIFVPPRPSRLSRRSQTERRARREQPVPRPDAGTSSTQCPARERAVDTGRLRPEPCHRSGRAPNQRGAVRRGRTTGAWRFRYHPPPAGRDGREPRTGSCRPAPERWRQRR